MQGKWDRRPQTERGRAQVLWRFHEGGGGCRQSGDVLMGEAVANIACDKLGFDGRRWDWLWPKFDGWESL